jgi:hypothetical protein
VRKARREAGLPEEEPKPVVEAAPVPDHDVEMIRWRNRNNPNAHYPKVYP